MIEFGKNKIIRWNFQVFIAIFICRVGFPEMPDISIKVVPVYGENQYAYTLLQDFLSAKVRAELKV